MTKKAQKPYIFYVIGSLLVGGTEKHLSMIAPALARRGYKVSVYNLSGQSVFDNVMANEGVEIISPPFGSLWSQSKLAQAVAISISALKLFLILLIRRPRITHFYLPKAYLIGAITARCAGLSRLIMSRRSLNKYQTNHSVLGWLERRLHRHMTMILGNSKSILSQLRDEENVPPEKLGLIYNAIDIDEFRLPLEAVRKRRELGVGNKTIVLSIVANLIPYKGHGDLLKALADIKTNLGNNWVLFVIGRDDGIESSLRRSASRLGLASHVRFLGQRDDIPDILRISDVGLLCSHQEGFSNAILEGMAAGLPMIVTDVGGNSEAVIDGVTGIIVKAHSPLSLGAAIRKLAANRRLRARMGRAGRRRVCEYFSLEACIDQYEILYKSLAAGKRPVNLTARIEGH